MDDILVVFAILLILLILISTFGGSSVVSAPGPSKRPTIKNNPPASSEGFNQSYDHFARDDGEWVAAAQGKYLYIDSGKEGFDGDDENTEYNAEGGLYEGFDGDDENTEYNAEGGLYEGFDGDDENTEYNAEGGLYEGFDGDDENTANAEELREGFDGDGDDENTEYNEGFGAHGYDGAQGEPQAYESYQMQSCTAECFNTGYQAGLSAAYG